jgi:hypothetical protein
MVRVPNSWRLHPQAGSQTSRMGAAARRISVTPPELYVNLVSVDIGNDGMAPVATFGAAGAASASCGPSGLGQSWALDQAYLSTSVGVLDAAQCSLYVGPNTGQAPPQSYLIVAGLSGGGNQFGLGGVGLADGWVVYCTWTGGTPGAQAFLRVTGTKTVLTQ